MCSTYSFSASITSRALFLCSWSRSDLRALSTASKAFCALSASSSFFPGCSYWDLLFISSSVTSGPIWKTAHDFRLKQEESEWVNHSIWFWGFRTESVFSILFLCGQKVINSSSMLPPLLPRASLFPEATVSLASYHVTSRLVFLKNCFSHGGNLWLQLKTSDITGNFDILCISFLSSQILLVETTVITC